MLLTTVITIIVTMINCLLSCYLSVPLKVPFTRSGKPFIINLPCQARHQGRLPAHPRSNK